MASYNNSNYSNDFFNLSGIYFNSTSQTNSSININELDIRYLQKTGGTISNNLLINGSLDIQTSLTLPIGNIATLIGSNELIVDGIQNTLEELEEEISNNTINIAENDNDISDLQGRLNIEELKIIDLQTLTASHTTNIASNTTNILTKQDIINDNDLTISKTLNLQSSLTNLQDNINLNTENILTKQSTINSSTDLETNSLTTTQFEVNGGVNIITKPHFDTIVFRRANNTPQINLGEIQCWVGGVNILPPNTNDLIGYFAGWSLDKSYPSGDLGSRLGTGQVFKVYNNAFEVDFGAHSNQYSSALIITNIPLTAVEDIQALVVYNRQNGSDEQEERIINMFFELYNSTNDPTYTTPLATTTPITASFYVYRFNFASISTYTGSFASVASITEIASDTFAETANGTFPDVSTFEITGDLIVSGDLTVENIIVNSTNIINELTSLDSRLDIEEPKTTALESLTEIHTTNIASLDSRLEVEEPKTTALQTLTASHTETILTKQATITTSTDLDCNSLTTNNLEVNGEVNIDTTGYFDTLVIRRPTGFSGDANFFLGLRELQCWVNDSNIFYDNGLTSNYALWSNKETSLGGLTAKVYNNITTEVSYEIIDTANSSDIALIIRNIPLTAINTIQSIVFYSRTAGKQHSEGLSIELYNSTTDPNLSKILANTNIITLRRSIYRFDFPAIDTYTGGFATDDSITQIVSEDDILIEDAIFIPFVVGITGDIVASGSIITDGVNINTTLTDILARLLALENP